MAIWYVCIFVKYMRRRKFVEMYFLVIASWKNTSRLEQCTVTKVLNFHKFGIYSLNE